MPNLVIVVVAQNQMLSNHSVVVLIGTRLKMGESLSQKYERILSMCEVGTRHGCYTQIACPCSGNHKHGDKEKSASLGLHNNGISFKCFAGCQTDDFLHVLGLTYKDLFPDNEDLYPSNIYTYHNSDGSYHHDKVKYRLPNGKKTFKQRTLDENGKVTWTAQCGIPFAYPKLIDGIKQGKVVGIMEGEKDALTGEILGLVSTTFGGASDWKDEYKKYFKDVNVILFPDKDGAGLKHANDMVNSLKSVVKSLKMVIMPVGKDLTEWVEAGNTDLQGLIEKTAVNLTETKGVPEPVIRDICGGYEFYWMGIDLKITIDHIENDDTVEIAVIEKEKPIYVSSFKVLSVSQKDILVKVLKKINAKFDWFTIVNQITTECLSRIRDGEQIVLLNTKIGLKKPEFLLYPMFVKSNPNIIYADRSSAKSLFMMAVSICLTMGFDWNGLESKETHTILWLDWENDANTAGWQKESILRGLELVDVDVAYLHLTRTLAKSIPQIQRKITEIDADVIVIDSLGVAVGGDLNASEPAINFFLALRQLNVTPLIIAHTAKDKNNPRKTVYGNAFYENLSRSIWEASKYQEDGSNHLVLSLYHRKNPPFSNRQKSLGFKFTFDGDKIYFDKCDPMADERDKEEK